MSATSSNSLFVLKLIGSLFSIITVLMTGVIIYLLTTTTIPASDEFRGFVVSSVILAFSTATIAFFVWWIISHRKRFFNSEQ